jgi:hypothetical protein
MKCIELISTFKKKERTRKIVEKQEHKEDHGQKWGQTPYFVGSKSLFLLLSLSFARWCF